MKLSDAVKQVGADENIEAAFTRIYGDQVQPENFRRLFNTLRKVSADMLQKIQQNADKTADEAFLAIHPDHVDIGQFMHAVIESRKPVSEVDKTTDAIETENAEG